MKTLNDFKSGQKVETLFGKIMQVRQQAHLLHLSSKSYAEHKALNEFYDGLTDLADELIEMYQGQYGIANIACPGTDDKKGVEFLTDAAKIFFDGHGAFAEKDSHLHNVLDEIVGLTYKTLYKVKNLK